MAKGAAPRLKKEADQAGAGYERNLARGEGEHDEILNSFRGFAGNGGFSPQDVSNIRARAVAPTRAIYSRANQDVSRQRALQGGYSPNFTAAKTRMARESSMALNEGNTNAEGMLGQLQQQGKLAGLGGMLSTHSAAPGLSQMYGNQALNAANALGQTKGDYQQGLSNVTQTVKAVYGMAYPWLN